MNATILRGDCRDLLRTLADNSVDSIVTDPPYELGFMGKGWDASGIAYDVGMWREALRVLKPGGHLLAFGGSRTSHRLVCAIEDAGFEIRDTIMWLYGSGFPKSKNLDGDWEGWGTALKPAHEPITMARKPLAGTVAANVLTHGTGALNIDGCRVSTNGEELREGAGGIPCRNDEMMPRGRSGQAAADRRYASEGGTSFAATPGPRGGDPAGRWPANVIHDGSDEVLAAFPDAPGQRGIAKADGSPQGNAIYGALRHGTKQPIPRVEADKSAARFFYCAKASKRDRNDGCAELPKRTSGMVSNTSGQHITRRDGGAPGPAANHHPTVKPTDLMRYLCRLVTPPGGTVLDPFTGSGSTGKAAVLEGLDFVGIELDKDERGQPAGYIDIACARIQHAGGSVVVVDGRPSAEVAA